MMLTYQQLTIPSSWKLKVDGTLIPAADVTKIK